MSEPRIRVVVVGAGSAGCLVAARLSEAPQLAVVLIEDGPDHSTHPAGRRLSSWNWLDALETHEAFVDGLVARRHAMDQPRQYRRGRGLGGTSLLNAMIAVPGLAADYDRWASDFGLRDWSWDNVRPVFAELERDLMQTPEGALTPVDRALLSAASQLGLPNDVDLRGESDGAGRLWLNARPGRRHSSRERYLTPALQEGRLEVRPGSRVDRVLVAEGRATGVQLVDGTVVEADIVVLCAGALESPAILLRSGLVRGGLGANLLDHPSVMILLKLHDEFRDVDRRKPAIGAGLRKSSSRGTNDLHILPVHGLPTGLADDFDGRIIVELMAAESSGRVELDAADPSGPPCIDQRMLSTSHDRSAMREGVDLALALLETDAFRRVVSGAFADPAGTPVERLRDDDYFEEWVTRSLSGAHAGGTVRMGRADDEEAVVDCRGKITGWQNVWVIDASVMPVVPTANPHLPVLMVATRLTEQLLKEIC